MDRDQKIVYLISKLERIQAGAAVSTRYLPEDLMKDIDLELDIMAPESIEILKKELLK